MIRVQLKRTKGWRMPENTVKVDRSTRWGNPFVVGVHGTRKECVDFFMGLMAGGVVLGFGKNDDGSWFADTQIAYRKHVKRNRRFLRGKNLACWCPLVDKDGKPVPCHADVLLEIANR